MTQDEVEQIVQKIIELAQLLGWTSTLSQTADGELLGMNIGSEKFLNYKAGHDPLKPSH